MPVIVVMNRVRVLEQVTSQRVMDSPNKWIEAGTPVSFGESESFIYKRRAETVLPFEKNGETYYVLESALNPVE